MTATPHPDAIALIAPLAPQSVSVRSGPGLQHAMIGTLSNGERIANLGKSLDKEGNEWLYLKRYASPGVPMLIGYVSLQKGLMRTLEVAPAPESDTVVISKTEYAELKKAKEEVTKLKDVIISQKTVVDDYLILRNLLTKPIPQEIRQ